MELAGAILVKLDVAGHGYIQDRGGALFNQEGGGRGIER